MSNSERLTVQRVNAYLHANGVPKGIRLVKGKGYYYFMGDDTAPYQPSSWASDAVYVFTANQLTFAQWLAEFNALKAEADKNKGDAPGETLHVKVR